MVAVAIMAILGTGLIVSTAGGRARASTVAVAEQMAQQFTEARESAIAQQRPFAVILPTTPLSALANSCYLADGAERAVVSKRVNLAGDFPGTYLFVGHWPLAAGSNQAPSPPKGTNNREVQLSNWAPDPSHAVYVYTPSGTLQSNQMEFDQAYHIVVCESAQWSPTGGTGPPSALLSAVSNPTTLVLSKTGQVSIKPQVVGQNGLNIGPLATYAGPVIPSLGPIPSGESAPIVKSVIVDPTPQRETLPDGICATVVPDGYLNLTVTASDPDGDPLTISWTAVDARDGSKRGGVFSSLHPEEIEYKDGVHQTTWEWKPPPTCRPDDRYTLTAKVSDGQHDVFKQISAQSHPVLVIDPGTILFADNRKGNRDIYRMNNDGTGQVALTDTPDNEFWPQLSPNGQRIMYVKEQGATQVLMTMGINGENPTQILAPGDTPNHVPSMAPHDSIVSCCWSPDGTQIAVVARYGGPTGGHDVYICNTDGSPGMFMPYDDPVDGLSVTDAPKVTWSFDGPYNRVDLSSQRLLYTSPYDRRFFAFGIDHTNEQPYNSEVYDINAGPDGRVCWVQGGALHVGVFDPASPNGLLSQRTISGGLANPKAPSWSPTGEAIVFSAGGSPSLYRVEADGSRSPAKITTPATALEASWGP